MKNRYELSDLQGLAIALFIPAGVMLLVSFLQMIPYLGSARREQIAQTQFWQLFLLGNVILVIGIVLLLVDNWMKARKRRNVSDEIG